MKVYPKITGCLCANTHPGSYSGQDAYSDMLPVIERNDSCVIGQDKVTLNLCEGGWQVP